MANKLTARDLLSLLAKRHEGDVFVPECKTGPSWGGGCLRMDAWAMARSWSKPWTAGYEIKATRRDFVQDDKAHLYLPYCSRFYFVCPWGLIDPGELPEGAGLIYATKTGGRLVTKHKAPERDVEVPEALFRYLLMSRVQIVRNMDQANAARESPREYWSRWLEERRIDFEFGQRVGREIRRTVHDRILDAERRMAKLEKENRGLAEVREILDRLGCSAGGMFGQRERHIREAFCNLVAGDDLIGSSAIWEAEHLAKAAAEFAERLREAKRKAREELDPGD